MKKTLVSLCAATLLGLSGAAQASLTVTTYSGAGWGGVGGVQNAIDHWTPTATATTDVIDFYDGNGWAGNYSHNYAFPGGLFDNIGMHVTGVVDITTAGTYDFRALADDGVQLKIDNQIVFTDDNYHPPVYVGNSMFLNTGVHSLDFIFFEGGGGATVELEARTGNDPFALIGAADGLSTQPGNPVPEPGSLALLGAGLLAAGVLRRRRG